MGKITPGESTTHESYDRVAKLWESDHLTKKFWQDNFDRFYKLLPEGKVLEIGCGAGRDAEELVGFGYDYMGTDISANQVELARKNHPGANFEQVSLYDLDYHELFNGFWCTAVLIHVPKARIDEALQSIHRNMLPKAVGFIAIKEGEGERLEVREELDNAEFLFSYWQNDEFKETLADNSMEVLSQGRMSFSQRTTWLTYHVRVN